MLKSAVKLLVRAKIERLVCVVFITTLLRVPNSVKNESPSKRLVLEEMMNPEKTITKKRQEVVLTCLDVFTSKGLLNTTSRDLSAALHLHNAGIYYYFKSKDDLIVACAQEAALQLEQGLIPLQEDMDDLDAVTKNLKRKCDRMAPKMKFLAQTFTVEKYREKLQPVLDAMSARYEAYARAFAERFDREFEDVAPFIYMGITAATDYMIFGDASYIKPQFELLKKHLRQDKN